MATAAASWYHCGVQVIGRSAGRTATAAAAYRCAARIRDEQTGITHDYTRRHGVEASFIVAPDHAPEWAHNLENLWNAAQAKDTRVNSCLAREITLALPSGIDAQGREGIVQDLSRHLVDRYGVAVSAALHEPSERGDDRNYHAHIMFTTRRMDEDGLGAKTRELDGGREEIRHIREYAAELINDALEDAGSDERVDHRSYADRGMDRLPTQHLGHEASAMERRGEASRIGDYNREVQEHNRELDTLVAELAALDAAIAQGQQEMLEPAREDRAVILPWEAYKPLAQGAESSALYQAFRSALEEQEGLPGMSLMDFATVFHQDVGPDADQEGTAWRDLVDNRRVDQGMDRDVDKDDPGEEPER